MTSDKPQPTPITGDPTAAVATTHAGASPGLRWEDPGQLLSAAVEN